MRQIQLKSARKRKYQTPFLLVIPVLLAILLAACAGAATSTSGGSSSINGQANQSGNGSTQGSSPSNNQGSSGSTYNGPSYLIKSLQVDMAVKDTRQVAADLQTWISTTDPQSTSTGIDYVQADDNLYNVSLKFSVQASLYDQIEQYLSAYAPQHGGKLLNLHQDSQDVTNDYIDTQSRLTNLRTAQTRLLTLLSHTNSVGDIITVQTQLTDVEGQIEQIEGHLNALKGQVTFYNVAISLEPLTTVGTTPSSPWNPVTIVQNAFSAGLGFAEVLLTILIWLAVFSVYIIPVALLAWFIWRRTRSKPAIASATASPPQATP